MCKNNPLESDFSKYAVCPLQFDGVGQGQYPVSSYHLNYLIPPLFEKFIFGPRQL